MKGIYKVFYRIINYLSDVDLPLDAGDFRLIDKQVINEVKKNNDNNLYLRGLISEIGFNQKGIPYSRKERQYGESKFKISDLIQLAFNGIVNHSNKPLYISALIGIIFALLTLGLIIVYFVLGLIYHKFWPTGFTSVILSLFTSISLNCFFFSIMGCYIGRIFNQVRSKPKYIIEKMTHE
jgi:dolichol-phosphate mannosyltransferase